MKRRIAALFTAFFVLMSSTAMAAKKDLKESYSNNIKIGLKNMMAASLNVTFNGSYNAGNNVVKSGTSLVLSQTNGEILFNNAEYSEITFVPASQSTTITIQNGSLKYSYIGSITFKALSDGNILPVNSVDIETYLKGVVGYEMSNSWPVEALKTQAVSARNYALANIGKHSSEGYDLSDGISDQVYKGYNSAYGNVIKAVDETKGMVLVYNDSPISTFYSASNGGYVESSKNAWVADIPYLQAKEDSFDLTKWPGGDKKFTTADIDSKLKSKGILDEQDKFIRLNIDTIQRNDSTRVGSIEVVYSDISGAESIKSITKERAWSFLSLPSSLYNVTYDSATDTYTFSGMGNGHGVGMSQIGAKNRANAGQKYDEILSFYFPGTELKNVGDIVESFSISKYEAYVGDTINFTANTSSSSTLFKYTVENNGQIIYTRDYSSDPNASYTVDRSGYFTVNLYSKDSSSSAEYDEHKTANFSAVNLLKIANISVLNQSITVNKPVTVNVEINGGAAAGVEYKFEAEKDHIIFHSGTVDVPNFTFTPKLTGEYTLYVSIRDKANTNGWDDMDSMKIVVNAESKPSTTTVKFSITRTLKKGVSGNDVKALQVALKTLGYFKYSTYTTYYGDVTVSAVKAFQKNSKLTANGVVDSKTAAAINSALIAKISKVQAPPPPATAAVFTLSRTLKIGMSGSDVGKLQEVLKKLGTYSYGTITNYFGATTQASVKAFQKANGLSQTGVVDSTVVKKINEKLK